jgi:hypothetical protein
VISLDVASSIAVASALSVLSLSTSSDLVLSIVVDSALSNVALSEVISVLSGTVPSMAVIPELSIVVLSDVSLPVVKVVLLAVYISVARISVFVLSAVAPDGLLVMPSVAVFSVALSVALSNRVVSVVLVSETLLLEVDASLSEVVLSSAL